MFHRIFHSCLWHPCSWQTCLLATALLLIPMTVSAQPPAVPGSGVPVVNEASGERGGSVLFYNYYVFDRTSIAQGVARENTDVNITNFHSERGVSVHLFFVNALTGGVWDSYVCLLPKQTATFSAAELEADAQVSGYVVAVAVDASGYPISFNHLAGSARIRVKSGYAAKLNAVAVPALFNNALPGRTPSATTARLNFDGVRYAQLPRAAALDTFGSTVDGHQTLLVLNRISGNFATQRLEPLGKLSGALYDFTGYPFGFTDSESRTQLVKTISDSFPDLKLPLPLTRYIPGGTSGSLEIWAEEDAPVLGAALNLNTGQGVNGGANLHKTTVTARGNLTIPISPSTCGDPNARADIAVALRASANRIAPGAELTYTVTVTNLGPDSSEAEMQYDLPNSVSFVSCVVEGGVCDRFQDRGRLNFGDLAAGVTKKATIVVRVDSAATEGSVITFSASVGVTTTDPIAANNEAEVKTTVGNSAANTGFKLGGRVTVQNRGLAEVKVYFTPTNFLGAAPLAVKTDDDGRWEQTGFQPGVRYGVTVAKPGAGCMFLPYALFAEDAADNLNFVCR